MIEQTFEDLGQLSESEVAQSSDLPVDGPETARHCIEVNEKVRSYRSWIRMGDPGEFSTEGWTTVAPGRYHVILRVRDDWDEWVAVDGEHYRNAGLWHHIDEPETSEMTLRLPLHLAAWVELLRNGKDIQQHSRSNRWGYAYIQLAFAAADFAGLELGPVSAHIWIDAHTFLIAKAVITHRDGSKEAQIEQMFTCHDGRVSIWTPNVNMGRDGIIRSNKVDIVPKWGIYVTPGRS